MLLFGILEELDLLKRASSSSFIFLPEKLRDDCLRDSLLPLLLVLSSFSFSFYSRFFTFSTGDDAVSFLSYFPINIYNLLFCL